MNVASANQHQELIADSESDSTLSLTLFREGSDRTT